MIKRTTIYLYDIKHTCAMKTSVLHVGLFFVSVNGNTTGVIATYWSGGLTTMIFLNSNLFTCLFKKKKAQMNRKLIKALIKH